MRRKVLQTIREYEMLRPGDRVTVGFSGGADSTALLYLLWQLREQLQIAVAACHINHQLRGQESQRDEDFVRAFCGQHGIPLTVERIDAAQGAQRAGESVETYSRAARYHLLEQAAGPQGKIATAHTMDDNAETKRDGPQRPGRHPAGARADCPPADRLHSQGGGGLLRTGGTPLCHRQHQPRRRLHPQPHPAPHRAADGAGERGLCQKRRCAQRHRPAGQRPARPTSLRGRNLPASGRAKAR